MPKPKREEAGSLSNSKRQKLQKLYAKCGAAYGSVLTLVKHCNLSVSTVRQFLQSKPSYAKFTPATRKFRRMTAFAGFKNQFWCLDLANVVKQAHEDNSVKYILVLEDFCHGTVDGKRLETKDSKETGRAFLTKISKKNRPKNV